LLGPLAVGAKRAEATGGDVNLAKSSKFLEARTKR